MRALQGYTPIQCSNAPLAKPGPVLQHQHVVSRLLQQQHCRRTSSTAGSPAAAWPAQTAALQPHRLSSNLQQQQLRRRSIASAAAAAQQVVDSATAIEQLRSKLQLHNSMTRKKEQFTPRPDMGNKVQMYVCGVTVYDYSHIGELSNRGTAWVHLANLQPKHSA